MKTTTESTVNFVYFSANHPKDFIDKVWEGDHLLEHIKGKWFRRSFWDFFFCLDTTNKRKLIEWVENNYDSKMY